MTADTLLALAGFAVATLYSPGPNNVMLMASGANFGLRRSVPHLLGVAVGFPLMAAAAGLGLGAVLAAWPGADVVLKALSAAFLLWIAWRVLRAGAPGEARAGARPLSFAQAAAFQWINPKAWAMATGAMGLYAAGGGAGAVLLVAAVFLVLGLGSATAWTAAGTQVRRLLAAGPRRLRLFNAAMAALIVASVVPMLV